MAREGAPIRIQGLAHRYGPVEAVRGIDLEIGPGELFGLLGPNGAGKTTTLSMLATLLPPSRGDASIFGASLTREPIAVRRSLGIAPQTVSVYTELSGLANVRFFGRLYGLAGARLDEAARGALERVGLAARAEDLARTYSGGMLRRLNLACALVHAPRLLLLDEPTVGVDPQSRDRLLEVVRQLANEGTTVLYTTHYMEEAQRLCDRIAIMDQGAIIACGRLDELLRIVGAGELIEIRGAAGAIEPGLYAQIPGLLASEPFESGLRLHVRNVGRALADLGLALSRAGGTVDRVDVHPVDLERVFIHLTGRALRD